MMISRGEVDAFSERTTQEAVSGSARLSHYHVGCSHHIAPFPDYGLWVYMWLEFGVWIPCSNLHPPGAMREANPTMTAHRSMHYCFSFACGFNLLIWPQGFQSSISKYDEGVIGTDSWAE